VYTKETIKETIKHSIRNREIKKERNKEYTHSFEIFWKAYPKKMNRGRAEKAWKSLNPAKELIDQILLSVEQHKRTFNWEKDGGQFIPHPATFLNARGWEDEIDEIGDDSRYPIIGAPARNET
jgi:hypothetical protein